MKKTLLLSICICVVFGMGGCANSANNTQEESSANSSQSTGSDSQKIEELEGKMDKIANAFSMEMGIDKDEFWTRLDEGGFIGDFHEIYDDSAVVEAYKNSDSSQLTDEKDKFIYDSLVKAVDEIIEDDMSDYEKEIAVYNYIFKETHFNENSLAAITDSSQEDYSHTPYGFFHDHSTICVGNATTFKLFMDVLGIDCQIIHSVQEGEHAWNLVKIDGDWYHCDVTFDGGVSEPDYAYFNVPDSAKENAGYPWNRDDFPECTSVKYCYSFVNAQEVKDVYEIPSAIKNGFKDKKTSVYMKLKIPEDVDSLIASNQISEIIESISPKDGGFGLSEISSVVADGYILFGISKYDINELMNMYSSASDLSGGLDIDSEKLKEEFSTKLFDYEFDYGYYEENGNYGQAEGMYFSESENSLNTENSSESNE